MFCKYCGAKVDEGRSYCPACGRGVSEMQGALPNNQVRIFKEKQKFHGGVAVLAIIAMLATFVCTFFIGIGQNGFASQSQSIFYYFKEIYLDLKETFFAMQEMSGDKIPVDAKIVFYLQAILTTAAVACSFLTSAVMMVLSIIQTSKAKKTNQSTKLKKYVAWSFGAFLFAVFSVLMIDGYHYCVDYGTKEINLSESLSLGALIGLCLCAGLVMIYVAVESKKHKHMITDADKRCFARNTFAVIAIVAFLGMVCGYGIKIDQKTSSVDFYTIEATLSPAGLVRWVQELKICGPYTGLLAENSYASLFWAVSVVSVGFSCLAAVGFISGKIKKLSVLISAASATFFMVMGLVFAILFQKVHKLGYGVIGTLTYYCDEEVGLFGPIIMTVLSAIILFVAICQTVYDVLKAKKSGRQVAIPYSKNKGNNVSQIEFNAPVTERVKVKEEKSKAQKINLLVPALAFAVMLATFVGTFFIGIGQNGFASYGTSVFRYFKEVYQELDVLLFYMAATTGKEVSLGAKLALYLPAILTTLVIVTSFATSIIMLIFAAIKTKKAKAENQPVNLKKQVVWSFGAFLLAVFGVLLYDAEYFESKTQKYIRNKNLSLEALLCVGVCLMLLVVYLILASRQSKKKHPKKDVLGVVLGATAFVIVIAFLLLLGIYGVKVEYDSRIIWESSKVDTKFWSTVSPAALIRFVYYTDWSSFLHEKNQASLGLLVSLSWVAAFLALVFACITVVCLIYGNEERGTAFKYSIIATISAVLRLVFDIIFEQRGEVKTTFIALNQTAVDGEIRLIGSIIAAAISVAMTLVIFIQEKNDTHRYLKGYK